MHKIDCLAVTGFFPGWRLVAQLKPVIAMRWRQLLIHADRGHLLVSLNYSEWDDGRCACLTGNIYCFDNNNISSFNKAFYY